MREVYNFVNRNKDGSVKLRLTEDGRYLMETANVEYFTEHNNEGTGDVKHLCALDPDGGPMFRTGYCFNVWLMPDSAEEGPVCVRDIEKVPDKGYLFTLDEFIGEGMFHDDIVINAYAMIEKYPYLRYGQAVFNYTEEKYGVSRYVQFNEGVDCFYNDDKVEHFIELAYEWYIKICQGRE